MRTRSKSSIVTPRRQTRSDLLPLITPGEMLADELMQPLGLAANALALALRVPSTRIQAILKCQRHNCRYGIATRPLFREFG